MANQGYTHLTDYDNNFNKIEFFSNEEESWITVNGNDVWQSCEIGHEFTGRSMFENDRDRLASR